MELEFFSSMCKGLTMQCIISERDYLSQSLLWVWIEMIIHDRQ